MVVELHRSSSEQEITFLVLGGQTRHLCGLRELGVCSFEAWKLSLTVIVSDEVPLMLNTSWTAVSALDLPFPSRCQASLISRIAHEGGSPFRPYFFWEHLSVVGGQLSYADPTCSSSPITVNEHWSVSASWTNTTEDVPRVYGNWTQQDNALFSPRRLGSSRSVVVVGGIRHVNLTRAADGAVAIAV